MKSLVNFIKDNGFLIWLLGITFTAGVMVTDINRKLTNDQSGIDKLNKTAAQNQEDHKAIISVLSDMQLNMKMLCDKNHVKYYESIHIGDKGNQNESR